MAEEHSRRIPTEMVARLIPRYAEPHRRYHTWHHVAHVFDASERISEDRSLALALAIFYHDAIYDPRRTDNEEASARLLVAEGERTGGIPPSTLGEAAALVRLTQHGAIDVWDRIDHPDNDRLYVLLDADLSILGAPEDAFDAYERAIAEEYADVCTPAEYAAGRKVFLEKLLRREWIFYSERGRRLWEGPARTNIARSIAALAKERHP